MTQPCFSKKDSSPLACGVHNVPLVQKQLPNEMVGAGYRRFTYLVCPATGTVLDDQTNKPLGEGRIGHSPVAGRMEVRTQDTTHPAGIRFLPRHSGSYRRDHSG